MDDKVESPPSESAGVAVVTIETELAGPDSPSHDQIAFLAYSYWEARGYQGGSPEEDWLRAERALSSGAGKE